MRRAVAAYDLSGRSGWAVYHPDLDKPVYGTLKLPPASTGGSAGPAFKLLFQHISWLDGKWPLERIGFEAFIAPTGGKKDDDKGFVTNPTTMKKQIGLIAILELCAEILEIEPVSINNASWRRYWLGSQPRGTQRAEWKRLAVAKANALGWPAKTDDEADALGQLHFLLHRMDIRPNYARRDPPPALTMLAIQSGVPLDV